MWSPSPNTTSLWITFQQSSGMDKNIQTPAVASQEYLQSCTSYHFSLPKKWMMKWNALDFYCCYSKTLHSQLKTHFRIKNKTKNYLCLLAQRLYFRTSILLGFCLFPLHEGIRSLTTVWKVEEVKFFNFFIIPAPFARIFHLEHPNIGLNILFQIP